MLGMIIAAIVIGIIAGYLGRLLLPGKDPMGFVGTVVAGIIGSLVGFFIFTSVLGIGDNDKFDLGGIIGADHRHDDRARDLPRRRRSRRHAHRRHHGPHDRLAQLGGARRRVGEPAATPRQPGAGGAMTDSDRKPSEQRGGPTPDAEEAREKGPWAETAREGIVPDDLGGSDAPRELLADDPELGSAVLGRTTGSEEPATESGVDLSAGDERRRGHRRRAGPARRRRARPQGRPHGPRLAHRAWAFTSTAALREAVRASVQNVAFRPVRRAGATFCTASGHNVAHRRADRPARRATLPGLPDSATPQCRS